MAHVVMLVHSDYYHDNRVVRQAELLAAEKYKVTVLAAEFGLSEPFRKGFKNGVEIITCRLEAATGKKKFYQMMKVFNHKLKHLRADVVHAHDLDTLLPAWNYARSRGIPLLYDSHELYLESAGLRNRRLNRSVWAFLEQFLIHRADNVITVCDSIADHLKTHYKLKTDPVVIRNFSAPSENPDSSEIPSPIQALRNRMPFMGIYQGVLRHGRGLAKLPEVLVKCTNWGMVICGDGPLRDKLWLKICEMGLEDRIILAGMLSHKVLQPVTSIADAGICYIEPITLSYKYALPNKLSEYVQAGVPVIGSDLPEIARIIRDYQVGYVCSTVDDIAEALHQLEIKSISDDLRVRLGKAAPELSWEKEGRKLTDLYEKIT